MGIVRRLKNDENLLIVKMISEHAKPMSKEDTERRCKEGLWLHYYYRHRSRMLMELNTNLYDDYEPI